MNLLYNNRSGENHWCWKGGRDIDSAGYVRINMRGHPKADSSNRVREHVVIAENILGKPLPKGAQIHHHGKRDDNTQIVICENQEYHALLHTRTRALRACGYANWRKCIRCGKYDDPANLCIYGKQAVHRECRIRYQRERRNA